MAVTKITEKTVADSLKDSAHVLVTQLESVNGVMTESLRRVPINMVKTKVNDNIGLSVVEGQLCMTYDDSGEDE